MIKNGFSRRFKNGFLATIVAFSLLFSILALYWLITSQGPMNEKYYAYRNKVNEVIAYKYNPDSFIVEESDVSDSIQIEEVRYWLDEDGLIRILERENGIITARSVQKWEANKWASVVHEELNPLEYLLKRIMLCGIVVSLCFVSISALLEIEEEE